MVNCLPPAYPATVFPGYEWENTYTLHFQTANSGIAICTGSAEADSWRQTNIKFTIK